jgi:putative ABC transport system permease protein
MWSNYLKVALRNLFRHKVFSLINILGLSIGLACAMLIILFAKDEFSFDRFHQKQNEIFRIVSEQYDDAGNYTGAGGFTGFFHGPAFAAQIPEIETIVRYEPYDYAIKKDGEVYRQNGIRVDADFFNVFSFPLLQGNTATALSQPNQVVLSEQTAIKFFGTTDVIGKTLEFQGEVGFEPFIVSGVAKRCPVNSSIRFDMLTPIVVPADALANKDNWFNFFLNTFVLLKPGTNAKLVSEKMQKIFEADAGDVVARMERDYGMKSKSKFLLQPLTDLHLNTEYRAGNGLSQANTPKYSIILSAIAFFILLIACINFINLTIARSLKRSKEIGIRKVIGGSRKQLVWQFLGESFIITFFAFILSLVLVQLVLPGFNTLANKALSLSYLLDTQLVIGYISLLIITGLLAGFYPAMVLSGFDPVKTLYNRFRFGGEGYLQKGLVVLQFTLATILIIGTLTIYRQFNYMIEMPLGYNDKNLIAVEKDGLTRDEFFRFRQALLQQPFIDAVAPRNSGYWSSVGKVNEDQNINFFMERVNEDFVPMMEIQVVEGRNFDPKIASDSLGSILVNQSFVKAAGWDNPIGKELTIIWENNKRYTVIGVVGDHHYSDLLTPIGPQVLFSKATEGYGSALIRIKEGSDRDAMAHIKSTFKTMFPLAPFEYGYRVDENREAYELEEKWRNIFLFGTLLSIFISCIGLFGLSVLNAERRTKEIGIRKILGASVVHVVSKLSAEFLVLVGIALVIGIPLALYGANQWLQDYPYRATPGILMVLSAVALVIFIAVITISFQSLRAAVSNPVKSLRTE